MKNILLLACILSNTYAIGQTTSATPFKGATVISVPFTGSAGQSLQRIAKVFVQQGFGIERMDTTLGYFDTAPRAYGQLSPAVFLYHVVAKNTVEITGQYQVKVGLQTISSPMQWTKSNLTQDKQCFLRAQEVAESYSPTLQYSTR
ncbi:hypothetical protein MUN82_08685 [Hymenobacter aerilatus]|uniref:Uncharacterized protein n=1 Tax=Hymenobacter aerilatus TaxID=2932251 RepID=A0A8T9SYK5_9BACT|nr:hypothetical protein [Hymenobacter aerilatus]UOR07158.1 hypothetical protein MUN82_08685 [Hymenobacter aerilatus]